MSGYLIQLRYRTQQSFISIATIAIVLLMGGVLPAQQRQNGKSNVTNDTIVISSDYSHRWKETNGNRALLRGRCKIKKGDMVFVAQQMAIWHRHGKKNGKLYDYIDVYMEGNVRAHLKKLTRTQHQMYVTFSSETGLEINSPHNIYKKPKRGSDFWKRATKRRAKETAGRKQKIRQIQYQHPQTALGPELNSVQISQPETRYRRVRIHPRSAVPYNVVSFESKKSTPPEQITVLTGGVNLLIDGIEEYGTIDLSADRVVIWTQQNNSDRFNADSTQTKETPYTVYMEGNIVIRQGRGEERRVIRAAYAVYDAREDRGLMLDAELKAFLPESGATIRVRAKQLRQLSNKSMHAKDAMVTPSKFGKPGYQIRSSDIYLNQRYPNNSWIGTGNSSIDPLTGARIQKPVTWLEARNNRFIVGDVPLFYTPLISGPADSPNIPLKSASLGNDSIFGFKFKSKWDGFQLLGMETPDGVKWDFNLDYLSKRGPAVGSNIKYAGDGLFGIPGRYSGRTESYYINDGGKDILGTGRNNLTPQTKNRGRFLLRHQQRMPNNIKSLAEVGILSDRNFQEQYNYNSFISEKDYETLLYLKQDIDNVSWEILASPQLNNFEYGTGWLPKGDLYVLSKPLLNGFATWSSHSSIGYGRLQNANPPTDPNDLFSPIPYMNDVSGVVAMTRHGIVAPFNIGALNITPFAWGEAAYWGEDLTGNSLGRLAGSAGVRSSLSFWKVFPYVNSRILNLNGLAHKIRLEGEYSYTESSADLGRIAQYNQIDDNAQERFRTRLLTNTFGGILPNTFDPRLFAVRTGAGSSITTPYNELINDQQVLRLAVRQRIQTKVGPPDRRRIKDWMTLDLEGAFFPDSGRDNFGEDIGLLNARYRWNVGDRTSLLADAYYDLFDNNQQLWSIGVVSQRSKRGSVYLGLRQVKGGNTPLKSQFAVASFSYAMSPKWVSTLATSYDLSEGKNRGQALTISRIGADFLFHFGFNYNESLKNTGIAFTIEPRLFGSSKGRNTSNPGGMNMGSLFGGGR